MYLVAVRATPKNVKAEIQIQLIHFRVFDIYKMFCLICFVFFGVRLFGGENWPICGCFLTVFRACRSLVGLN